MTDVIIISVLSKIHYSNRIIKLNNTFANKNQQEKLAYFLKCGLSFAEFIKCKH